jgi:predicted aspartyl protease
MPVEVAPTGNVPSPEVQGEGTGMSQETTVKSKILSHFIKGKISLSPMETVLMILGELEHLESLVKLARRKKDAKTVNDQVSVVSSVPKIRRICVNRTNRSKTLHLPVEINGYVVEGLVDTGASMFVMAAAVVRELRMMHLIAGSKTYKIASGIVTQALGRINKVPIKVGGVQCTMTFMVVDIDSYDVLLGLDFLMKIRAIVDVEWGVIQVRKGPGTDVEVLPLTMVNLLQRMNLGSLIQDTISIWMETHNDGDSDWISDQDRAIMTKEGGSSTSALDADTDDSERNDSESNQLKQIDCQNEFGDIELEELVKSKGPQEILQLTIQEQANEFMKEEITDSDNYAD